VILFFPGLNKYRSFVIRDFGYLAFYMLGLLVFFKHIVKPQWYWPAIWTALLAIAAAFRIEAIAVLVCLPFVSAYVLADTGRQRTRVVISLVAVFAVLFMLGAWWFAGNASGTDSFAGLFNTFIANIKQGYEIRLHDMRQLLTSMSDNYALLALIATGSIIFIAEVVKRITLLYTLMAVYGWVRGFLFRPERAQRAWLGLIIVQLIILSGTMLLQFFLTGRFPLALSLTVLLIVPFVWVNMYDEWRDRSSLGGSSRWLFPTALVFAIILGIQGLTGFTGKAHLKEGGLWLQQQLKDEQTLLSNERAVMYYAKQDTYRRSDIYQWQTIDRMLANGQWQQYDYIALRFKRRHADHKQQVMQRIGSAPIKTFQGKRGDVLLVFRVRQS